MIFKTGVHGAYSWFQAKGNFLSILVDRVPDLISAKYVAVAAHDGEPLKLTSDEIRSGWQRHSRVALSPIVERAFELPQNQFDEWYIFNSLAPFDVRELFVNYGGFSLAGAGENPFIPERIRKDKGAKQSTLAQMQKRFWQQIDAIKPESYVAESDKIIVVSRDHELVAQLQQFFSQSSMGLTQRQLLPPRIHQTLINAARKMRELTLQHAR